jgi:hypothetical protein
MSLISSLPASSVARSLSVINLTLAFDICEMKSRRDQWILPIPLPQALSLALKLTSAQIGGQVPVPYAGKLIRDLHRRIKQGDT